MDGSVESSPACLGSSLAACTGFTPVGASVFVRFYAPTNCEIQNESFVRWADAILKLESTTADDSESD